ncbi:MAG TPA: PAS domain S-box protein [Terriglobales bacterium]|nr:PAS domain S-box protein [Terriglobales bacterium]
MFFRGGRMASQRNAPVILCVDDDSTGLRFRQLMLEAKGYRVLLATSAQQGMEVFQSNAVDLVITDHLIGRAMGTAMAAALKRLRPDIPIIILSGSSNPPEGTENADVFVCKSEGPEVLLHRVSALLGRAASRQEPAEVGADQLTLLSRERLATIVESVMDAIITVGDDQRIVLFNKAAETIFRCPSEEALGKPLDTFIPERFRASHREHIQRFGHTGVTSRSMSSPSVLVGLRADGEEFPIEATISQVGGDEEKFFTVVLRDITARKQAEEKQSQLAAIVESSDDAIISKTLEGIVVTWNNAAERMYGYCAQEIIGKPISILFPADRLAEGDQVLASIRRGERVEHFETTRVTKDGRLLNVALTVSPMRDANGTIIGASTIARDLTQIKMAEQALRNSEKLVVAGRMAATVAHEINGPLEAVANILFLLEQAELGHTAREFISMAQEEVKRIGQITKLTLGFHREGEERRAVPLKISELFDGILTLYGYRIESLGVTIEKRYDSAGEVIGDASELRQVFSNLIVNAVDALAKMGDRLCIHVRDSVEWGDMGRKGVRIIVADNGSGIPREIRHRLFEPFFTTKGEKGTGLGLWVSQSLVEKHGGQLRVRSTPGVGTAFSIFLPTSVANAKVA